jgi:hypothetical protein
MSREPSVNALFILLWHNTILPPIMHFRLDILTALVAFSPLFVLAAPSSRNYTECAVSLPSPFLSLLANSPTHPM